MPSKPVKKEDYLAALLSAAFGRAAFRVDRSKPFIFICGGSETDALRGQFLRLVLNQPRRIVPILAEQIFVHQLVERNLQKFETFLATSAECILIFAESPGSFAETGLFAALKEIRKNTLVVNTQTESRIGSFLNLGPIRLIRRKSRFDTNVDLANKCITDAEAENILQAILSNCEKYKTSLVFHPQPKFADLELRLQLGCVHLSVTLIYAGSANLVVYILRKYFKAVDTEEVGKLLSLLIGIKLLERVDEIYFNPNPEGLKDDPLIQSVSFSIDNVRAKALEWHAENNSQIATFLREQRGIDL